MTSFAFWTGNGLTEIVNALGIDLNRLLHSEEEYEYYGNIYAGDTITRKMKVVEMYNRGKRDRLGDCGGHYTGIRSYKSAGRIGR